MGESSNNYELLNNCGGSGFPGARIKTIDSVLIPDFIWTMVVVVPPGGGLAANRIAATNRLIAVKIPNSDSAANAWSACVTELKTYTIHVYALA